MILALHYLQGYYLVEISHGKQELGSYDLHSKFSPKVQTQPPLISEQSTYSPEDIVGRISRGQQGLGNYHMHSKVSPMVQIQPPLIHQRI